MKWHRKPNLFFWLMNAKPDRELRGPQGACSCAPCQDERASCRERGFENARVSSSTKDLLSSDTRAMLARLPRLVERKVYQIRLRAAPGLPPLSAALLRGSPSSRPALRMGRRCGQVRLWMAPPARRHLVWDRRPDTTPRATG